MLPQFYLYCCNLNYSFANSIKIYLSTTRRQKICHGLTVHLIAMWRLNGVECVYPVIYEIIPRPAPIHLSSAANGSIQMAKTAKAVAKKRAQLYCVVISEPATNCFPIGKSEDLRCGVADETGIKTDLFALTAESESFHLLPTIKECATRRNLVECCFFFHFTNALLVFANGHDWAALILVKF